MLGKNGLHIGIQREKSHQNDELFFLGFEKVLKMQPVFFMLRRFCDGGKWTTRMVVCGINGSHCDGALTCVTGRVVV